MTARKELPNWIEAEDMDPSQKRAFFALIKRVAIRDNSSGEIVYVHWKDFPYVITANYIGRAWVDQGSIERINDWFNDNHICGEAEMISDYEIGVQA